MNDLRRVVLDWIRWDRYKIVFFPIMVGIMDRVNDVVIIVHGPSHGIQAIACPYLHIFRDRAGKEFDQMMVILLAKPRPKKELRENENCCWGIFSKTIFLNCT